MQVDSQCGVLGYVEGLPVLVRRCFQTRVTDACGQHAAIPALQPCFQQANGRVAGHVGIGPVTRARLKA